jgi:hypothetical protein
MAPEPRRRVRSPCRGALLLILAAGGRARATPHNAEADGRSWSLELRAGPGIDTNVLRDPQATTQAALVRVEVESELSPARDLQLTFSGWFEQHLPHYEVNETSLELFLVYRRPIIGRLSIVLGSLSLYHRELTNFVEGTVLTHGSELLSQAAEHASVGLELRFGRLDLTLGGDGHAKTVSSFESFDVYGVDGTVALRWIPLAALSLRLRYMFLFEDVHGLTLLDVTGQPTGVQSDLWIRTHQVDFMARARPLSWLSFFARYELAFVDDNYLGYLYGNEHRVVTGLRIDPEGRWVVDLSGRMFLRSYPLRVASPDNQTTDLPFDAVADVELWLHRHWGLFVRYELSGENAAPFGTVFIRHTVVAGVASKAGIEW